MTPLKDPESRFRSAKEPDRAGSGKRDREPGALPRLAGDVELAPVAVDDVLDDGEAQARSALVAALRHVDPVEPLGQARQVLGRDAGAVILHREATCAAPAPRVARRSISTSTLPPLSPYFTAFSIRFSATRRSSSRSPSTRTGCPGSSALMTTPRSFARGDRVSIICEAMEARSTVCVGEKMGAHLDARQGQEIVDQALHALRLALHDVEEALPGLGIVARGALQGLDEAEDRGQRRAQFMARIGDEIGPHGLQPPGRGEIAEEQDDAGLDLGVRRIGLQGADMHLEGPLGRNPLRILDLQGLAVLQHLAGCRRAHPGLRRAKDRGWPGLQPGQQGMGGLVGLEHHGPLVHQDDRIGDLGQNRLGDAGARGLPSAAMCSWFRARGCACGPATRNPARMATSGPEQKPRIPIAPHQRNDHQHEAGHDGPAQSGIPDRGGALPAGIRREVVGIAHGRILRQGVWRRCRPSLGQAPAGVISRRAPPPRDFVLVRLEGEPGGPDAVADLVGAEDRESDHEGHEVIAEAVEEQRAQHRLAGIVRQGQQDGGLEDPEAARRMARHARA